jgi:hypothetical protein
MKAREQVPELHEAIAAHARALAAGDASSEKFVLPRAIEAYRKADAKIAQMPKPIEVEPLAQAKIGAQYVSKLGIASAGRRRRVLYRWRREDDGRWLIAEVEDISEKRSPWSDIPDLVAAAAEKRAEARNA